MRALHAYFDADDEEFVDRVYGLLLRREPDQVARGRALESLRDGTLSRATLIHELATSPEFGRIRALDDAVARAVEARGANERPRHLTAPPGTDERPIEIAWTLSRYRGERHVLDVGYANAEPAYLAALLAAAPEQPVGVDLAEAGIAGIDGVKADVRNLPFGARSFAVVLCISTLEHVGKDNSLYGIAAERGPAAIPIALRELKRVLRRHGRLLLTVPTGDDEDHEWFVQRDPGSWRELFHEAGFAIFEDEVYELGPEGWRSIESLPAGVRYGARGPGASAVLCAELRPGRLRSAIRRRARAALPGGRGG